MLVNLKKKIRGFTLIELMIVVAIIGILAAIAIPNFIRFQAKSKQSEAKTNLKSIYTAQKAYFGEKDKYVTDFKAVGFSPEANNRYAYCMQGGSTCNAAASYSGRTYTDGVIGMDSAKYTALSAAVDALASTDLGVIGTCPNCEFGAEAMGNVDNDSDGDAWAITSATTGVTLNSTCGIDSTATSIGGGEPGNAYNDVSCS